MIRMVRHFATTLTITAVCAGFAVSASAQTAPPAVADLAIVVNASTPVSRLSFAELQQIFRGDKQYWAGGIPVVLLIRAPTSVERDAVLNTIYRMQEAQFKQYWIAKIFKADLTSPPKIVYSNETALAVVGSIAGAIAFVPANDVKPDMKIKVIRIDDRLPGEAGYPLHLTAK